jgi:hypothetical protein
MGLGRLAVGGEVKYYGCGVVVGMWDVMWRREKAKQNCAKKLRHHCMAMTITNSHIKKKCP